MLQFIKALIENDTCLRAKGSTSMFTLKLESKEDVHILRDRLQLLCDQEGIRLGNSNMKAEKILSGLLGVRGYNTLIGVATNDTRGRD